MWEYKVIRLKDYDLKTEEELNALGAGIQGWELLSVTSMTLSGQTFWVHYTFKRKLN